ncbi:MAG: hypothetical protein HC880_17505 [Bacteroidia bacterium]|nr:hypothetical protein [Bacteroidia bacterium]
MATIPFFFLTAMDPDDAKTFFGRRAFKGFVSDELSLFAGIFDHETVGPFDIMLFYVVMKIPDLRSVGRDERDKYAAVEMDMEEAVEVAQLAILDI